HPPPGASDAVGDARVRERERRRRPREAGDDEQAPEAIVPIAPEGIEADPDRPRDRQRLGDRAHDVAEVGRAGEPDPERNERQGEAKRGDLPLSRCRKRAIAAPALQRIAVLGYLDARWFRHAWSYRDQ